MHLAPFTPIPKQLLTKYREAGMRAAVRCCAIMGILMVLMFLAPSIFSGITGGLVNHALALAVTMCIVGILASIYFIWSPAHDELVRRKNEPYHEGARVRWNALARRFFSVSPLRATPPPRAVHR
ncbi:MULTISPECIES: hypothetical protein [Burkholderiales]|uniref:hypothetical protein n=1 Tax=Burkholderiales TaxID=80840 RepID=UPI00126757C6|nr:MULTISPECIES: hypothetical protein [Burkholderiales]